MSGSFQKRLTFVLVVILVSLIFLSIDRHGVDVLPAQCSKGALRRLID